MTTTQEDNIGKVASLMTRVTDQGHIDHFLENETWLNNEYTYKAFFQCEENIVVTGRGSGDQVWLVVQTTDDEFFAVYADDDTTQPMPHESLDIMFMVESVVRTVLHSA